MTTCFGATTDCLGAALPMLAAMVIVTPAGSAVICANLAARSSSTVSSKLAARVSGPRPRR